MIETLSKKFEKRRMKMNMDKTEYICIRELQDNIQIRSQTMKVKAMLPKTLTTGLEWEGQ